MNRYEERLRRILNKYQCVPPKVVDGSLINSIIADAITKRCVDKTVAIWGVGKKNAVNGHCYMIIQKFILNLGGLKWLIDSDRDMQGTEFLGYPIIAPEADVIREKEIDIIIIASKNSRESIRKTINQTVPECEVLDLYEELEKQGVRIDFNFFTETNIYTELYRYRMKYEKGETDQERQQAIEDLIALYFKIRDFKYGEKYIHEYCNRNYRKADDYLKMLEEIRSLCEEVKQANLGRKDDIIIHLIDSARAMDVYRKNQDGTISLNVFSSYEKEAAIFSEAYSTGPTTYESMIGTIKQKLSYDENVYADNHFIFDLNEFEFLDKVHDRGMPIRFYISKDYQIMNPHPDIVFIEQLHMPEKLWTLACDLAESKEPVFNMVYYPWELHFPMLCGYMTNEPQVRAFVDVGLVDMSWFIEQQLSDCLKYVNDQFTYYHDFFSPNTTTVILADHSQPVYDPKRFVPFFLFCNDKDRVSHVTFMICHPELPHGTFDDLISMLDFNKIIEAACFEHRIDIPHRDVVQYQFYNIQNRKLREKAMELGVMDFTEGIQCFLSKEYLYIKTATGVRQVFRVDNASENVIETEGKEFASYVESHFDTGFPGFWTVRKNEI